MLLHFEYPQISQTYIETERRILAERYDVELVCINLPNIAIREHAPFHVLKPLSVEGLVKMVRWIKPDIVHGHYLHMVQLLHLAARIAGVPFTVRTHSADVLVPAERAKTDRYVPFLNDELCQGVLAFPPCRALLIEAGVKPEKIIDARPVVDFARFHDRSPNGKAIMNMGAAIVKKNMGDFLKLSRLMPEREFNLYAMGYKVKELQALNAEIGGRANFVPVIEPSRMPPEYKKHEWLVYTGSPELPYSGWPLAIAEAQAAGVGVCMQNIRPDIRDYVGEAGFVFDNIEEARRIVSQPFSAELREKGFAQAKKSDIRDTIGELEALWA